MTDGKLSKALQWVQQTASAGVSDSELLHRYLAGDEAAFELLLWRHQRLVFGVCRRLLHRLHDAEDAFQATFLVLARKARSISRSETLAAWLYRVAYRCALTVRARRARHEQPLMPDRDVPVADESAQSAERRELAAILDEELHRLPEQFRVPAVLCYLTGQTVDEAAAQLGCPRGTVASRLARARERLRVRLSRRGVALPAGATVLALGDEASRAAAPDGLIRSVLMNLHATGHAAAGTAVVVANQVVRAMFLRKLVVTTTALTLMAGVLLAGSTWAMHAVAQGQDPPRPVAPAAQAGAQAAPNADPVPPAKPAQPALAAQDYTGRLEPSQVIDIRTRAGGAIDKVHIKEGARVKKGDVLIEIDARAARLDLEQARANLAAAQAQATLARATLERLQRLVEQNAVAREEVDERKATVASAEANLALARAKVELAQLHVEATRITAPIAGQVSRLNVSAGQVIAGDDKAPILATLTVVDPISIRFAMDENVFVRYQQLMRTGKVQDIDLRVGVPAADEKGYPHQAKVVSFAPSVDEKTGTINVRGTLANPDGQLLPGMFVLVRVTFVPPAKR
jgi:RND family efflux transporter MFP subunit